MEDNMERRGICIAGSLIADRYYEVDTYPKEGFLSTIRSSTFHIGGSGNIILDLAKLDPDLKVKVCAIIGDDDSGKGLLDILSRYKNIDVDCILKENESSVTLVVNANDTKQRTFLYLPGASDAFDMSCIDWDKIDSRIFHLEYLLLMKNVDAADADFGTHGARILKYAKDRGMMTSFDMVSEQSDRVPEIIRPALRYTDICCINESEAEAVTGIKLCENRILSEEKTALALKKLCELGVSKWVVIHSPMKSYGYDVKNDKIVSVDSLKLPEGFIKGTTGAGDAFCSGILYGAHADYQLADAMRLAIACAACSLSQSNGTDGVRSEREALLLSEQYK
ncbi:MAG: carbohydrate kinase family protein [Clostridia bacterium]|nr:carbohydrate kinase family protein [Clostridia bacterium]